MTPKSFVQFVGMAFSRAVFRPSVLQSASGKRLYLLLYLSFKRLFESGEVVEMCAHVRPGSTVLDIGANVGWTAMGFSHAVGAAGRVLAFEPDPLMVDVFRFHMEPYQNVQLFACAVGVREAELPFFQNPSNRADNRMAEDAETLPGATRITVPVRSIAEIAAQQPDAFQNVSFIKIDVQGYESQVMVGMEPWLSKLPNKPVLRLELWPYGLEKAGSSADELFAVLERIGYSVTSQTRDLAQRLSGPDAYGDAFFFP
jgi:FkbM family methyltransferase